MDAKKGNIFELLNGFKQFIIPVYQRVYSWEIKQCAKLWQDIVDMQKQDRVGHFVGSIVNVAEQVMPTGVQKYMIIDGQQRMTTLTILLIALRDYILENPQLETVNTNMITDMCLKNSFQQGDDTYKLLLTKSDRQIIIELIERIPYQNPNSNRIINNYNFLKSKINNKELEPHLIYEAIGKLQLVNITLDRNVDDPQLIFESLNSTGMDLSQSDLIRNHILMGLDNADQIRIYNNIWHPMEIFFGYDRQSDLMDRFFRDYLTFKNTRIPNISKVYEEFKNYHSSLPYESIDDFCEDIYNAANLYTNVIFANSSSPELNDLFNEINTLQMDVVYPFVIKVYIDYNNNKITHDEFAKTLKISISYVVRRAICGIPTNSLNKTFSTLKNKIQEDEYFESFKLALVVLDSYTRFPNDVDFISSLMVKDIYNMRIRNYILWKIESYNNKTPIIISNYTIEHIMPQNNNLSLEWKKCLGEDIWESVQEKYLHTIGNLTLTAYNSEMSDKTFNEKLEMTGGFKESGLRMNSFLLNQTTWNSDLIIERAETLCALCAKIWAYPSVDKALIEKYKEEKNNTIYTLDDYEYLNDVTRSLYDYLDKKIMNLYPNARKEFKKKYIAYKNETNFLDVIIQKTKLKLIINMKFKDIIDPEGICKDNTEIGNWGNGDIELSFENISQIEDIIFIIEQSYNNN